MDSDILEIYKKLHERYPIIINSSIAVRPTFKTEFPILCGISRLGRFELFFDDVSFAFYAMHDNGAVFAHWHAHSVAEAEQAVVDFMNGKMTLVQFGRQNTI